MALHLCLRSAVKDIAGFEEKVLYAKALLDLVASPVKHYYYFMGLPLEQRTAFAEVHPEFADFVDITYWHLDKNKKGLPSSYRAFVFLCNIFFIEDGVMNWAAIAFLLTDWAKVKERLLQNEALPSSDPKKVNFRATVDANAETCYEAVQEVVTEMNATKEGRIYLTFFEIREASQQSG